MNTTPTTMFHTRLQDISQPMEKKTFAHVEETPAHQALWAHANLSTAVILEVIGIINII